MALFSLWPATSGPGNADTAVAVSLGTEVTTSQPLWVTHLRYWRGTTSDSGTHTGEVYNSVTQAAISGTIVTFTDVGTGWQTAALASPVQIPAGTYIPAVHHPNGGPAFTSAYWTSGPGASGITNGPISAPNNAGSIRGQGLYTTGAVRACPASTYNGNGYWTDWIVSDVEPDTVRLSAQTALAASGVRTALATAGLTAQFALAATGDRTAQAAAALTAQTVLAVSGVRDAVAAATLSAAAIVTGTGSRNAVAQLALAAHGRLDIGDVPTLHLAAAARLLPGLHLTIPRPNSGTIHRP